MYHALLTKTCSCAAKNGKVSGIFKISCLTVDAVSSSIYSPNAAILKALRLSSISYRVACQRVGMDLGFATDCSAICNNGGSDFLLFSLGAIFRRTPLNSKSTVAGSSLFEHLRQQTRVGVVVPLRSMGIKDSPGHLSLRSINTTTLGHFGAWQPVLPSHRQNALLFLIQVDHLVQMAHLLQPIRQETSEGVICR